MKQYSKDELAIEFGKPSWASNILVGKVKYISGLEVFDSKFLESNQTTFGFEKYPNGFIINLLHGWSKDRTGVLIDNIKYIVIEPQEQIVTKKSKSVVGRALVGGLLLGPLGAVVGGISGVGSKDTKLSDLPDNILSICFEEESEEKFILFSVANKNFNDVEKSLKTSFPEQYKHFNEIAKDEPKIQSDNYSIADEIRKLKEFLDMDVLTQLEFDEQKQKILNR